MRLLCAVDVVELKHDCFERQEILCRNERSDALFELCCECIERAYLQQMALPKRDAANADADDGRRKHGVGVLRTAGLFEVLDELV